MSYAETLIAIATTGALCEKCPTPWGVEKSENYACTKISCSPQRSPTLDR